MLGRNKISPFDVTRERNFTKNCDRLLWKPRFVESLLFVFSSFHRTTTAVCPLMSTIRTSFFTKLRVRAFSARWRYLKSGWYFKAFLQQDYLISTKWKTTGKFQRWKHNFREKFTSSNRCFLNSYLPLFTFIYSNYIFRTKRFIRVITRKRRIYYYIQNRTRNVSQCITTVYTFPRSTARLKWFRNFEYKYEWKSESCRMEDCEKIHQ